MTPQAAKHYAPIVADRSVVAVDIVSSGTQLMAGTPHELFRSTMDQNCTSSRCYDISPDGSRFLFRDHGTASRLSVTRMDLVLNWTATLPGADNAAKLDEFWLPSLIGTETRRSGYGPRPGPKR